MDTPTPLPFKAFQIKFSSYGQQVTTLLHTAYANMQRFAGHPLDTQGSFFQTLIRYAAQYEDPASTTPLGTQEATQADTEQQRENQRLRTELENLKDRLQQYKDKHQEQHIHIKRLEKQIETLSEIPSKGPQAEQGHRTQEDETPPAFTFSLGDPFADELLLSVSHLENAPGQRLVRDLFVSYQVQGPGRTPHKLLPLKKIQQIYKSHQ